MAKRIFQEKGFHTSVMATAEGQALIAETFGVLRDAISSSITFEVPEILTYALENNAFVFSGFKTFHAIREVGLSLTDLDGTIKPFNRFLNDVRKINDRYNHNYLRAEYNQAMAASQMAARWHQFEQDGDDYYLQYRTVGDANVREEHALLHNTTLPITDPFWDSFLPPNGWNCRCLAVQVRKDKYPMSDPELAMKRGRNCTDGAKRQIFRFNPGKAMRLFPERHPYYKAPEQDKQVIGDITRKEFNRTIYNKLKEDKDYTDVEFNETTGGVKATHIGHNTHPNDNVRYFNGTLTGDDLEREFMQLAFDSGHSVIFNNESKIGNNGNQLSSLDMTFDGVVMDIKSITKLKNHYGAALISKNKQLHRYNHRSDVPIKTDTVCLYFHDNTMFSDAKILDGVNYMSKNSKTVAIKHIICAVKTNAGLKLINFNI